MQGPSRLLTHRHVFLLPVVQRRTDGLCRRRPRWPRIKRTLNKRQTRPHKLVPYAQHLRHQRSPLHCTALPFFAALQFYHPPLGTQYGNEHTDSRSRSRSRPPSVGPTRSATTRGRRTNSISSTSPPPQSRPNPSHIIIPTRPGPSPSPSSALSTGWYIPPTPDSLGNPHSLPYPHYDDHQQQHQGMVSASFPNFSPASAFTPPPSSNANSQDKQALLANEKRRRRRESHNAVERRRRDNINEKITELATLIPECLLEGAGTNGNGTSAASPPAPDDLWGSLLKEDESPPPVGVADVVANGATGNGCRYQSEQGYDSQQECRVYSVRTFLPRWLSHLIPL